jgi:hypothetical protein
MYIYLLPIPSMRNSNIVINSIMYIFIFKNIKFHYVKYKVIKKVIVGGSQNVNYCVLGQIPNWLF